MMDRRTFVAKALGIDIRKFEPRGPNELEAIFSAMAKQRVDAVVTPQDAMIDAHAREIADLAAKMHIPSAGNKALADAGGLIGYGVNVFEIYRRAGTYVDKILKGAKPADLPVEQATKFELIINLKAAKALGITIPQSVLLRADEVIQ
jgi:putative ABC transport system substrate-binding protein